MGFTICSGFCKTLPAKYGKKGSDKYEYNAYCRKCKKNFLKSLLKENKLGGKVLCPCCNGQARLTPSSSSKNRRDKKSVLFEFDMMEK